MFEQNSIQMHTEKKRINFSFFERFNLPAQVDLNISYADPTSAELQNLAMALLPNVHLIQVNLFPYGEFSHKY